MKYVLSIFLILLFAFGCESTEPINKGKLYITTEDVSCTEAWIKVAVNDVALPAELQLFRNDSVAQIINLSRSDTVIYEDSLAPSTEYNYTAKLAGISSGIAAVRTMDTTSHDFTWETFTFGGGSSSSLLNDVAIIDENNIWAVGEIHTTETDQYDSNGVWVQPYNAVHWDRNQWELKRLMFYNDQDQPEAGKTASECQSAYLFNDNTLAISSNVQTIFINTDGNTKILKMGFLWENRFTINAIWGISNSDFYVVGNGGNIAHYNGSSWKKIESGTETQIRDIWGWVDITPGRKKVLCAVSNVITLGDNKILEVNNDNTVSAISWETGAVDKRVNSIWFNDNHQTFTCGGGVFISSVIGLWNTQPLSPIHTNKIRGIEKNDVFVAGDYGFLAHFNGLNWKEYNTENAALFYSLDYAKDILVAVGGRNNEAVILRMKKQ